MPAKSSRKAAQETLIHSAVSTKLYLFKFFSVEFAAGQEITFLLKTNDKNEKKIKNPNPISNTQSPTCQICG